MFSDAPHLIKNVRNRLQSKKSLRVIILEYNVGTFIILNTAFISGFFFKESSDIPYIRWSHYVEVYNNDVDRKSNAPTRVCPKITQRHIAPDNFSKINVKLATQVPKYTNYYFIKY